ncbi:MAG: antitoxin [Rhodomicrobium sp.]
MSRLTIDITEQQHKALKAMAALEGKTIRQYALEKLFPPATEEEQAWADLKNLVERRIAESAAGAVSSKTFDEIVDEELGAGGAA